MDPQALYVQLGRLSENIPNFFETRPFSAGTHQWLARMHALLAASGYSEEAGRIKSLTASMGGSANVSEVNEIYGILFRILATAELQAPAPMQGAFIPVGNAFDALTSIGKLLKQATRDLLIVDPYLDEKVLTEFALQASEGVQIRLLSDSGTYKATLRPAASRWIAQFGATRPLAVRLAPAKSLHDRLILIDQRQTWVLTQSLKDFALRSPASITKSDDETASLKAVAYQAIWDSAAPL